MTTKLKAWGNSLAIRISRELLQEAGMKENDLLDIRIENGELIISKKIMHRTLKERAAEYGGRLNISEEIDWGEPVGCEVW